MMGKPDETVSDGRGRGTWTINLSAAGSTPERRLNYLWWNSLKKESDRGAALLAMAAIDEVMKWCLCTQFVESKSVQDKLFKEGRAPLQPSSARRLLLRAMGIISVDTESDIKRMAVIRNIFGHEAVSVSNDSRRMAELTFDSPGVKTECRKLITPTKRVFEGNRKNSIVIYLSPTKQYAKKVMDESTNRQLFMWTAHYIYATLTHAAMFPDEHDPEMPGALKMPF